MSADEPVYFAQFAGLLSSPCWTTGAPFVPVTVAPPMMLLMARAATCRLSTGLAGLYGWCRLSDQATAPPCAGEIGSRAWRPLLASLKFALFPLAISENTHRTWLVDESQAKLTRFGSDATLGFLQAVVISVL